MQHNPTVPLPDFKVQASPDAHCTLHVVGDTRCDSSLDDEYAELINKALDFVRTMASMTTPEDEFAEHGGDDDGRRYDSVDDYVSDLDSDRLYGEYDAFMSMVRDARTILNGEPSELIAA